MQNPRGEEKSDGLEIISIGVLYDGSSWDKKYWSCSRGKDRYPYPVGYSAVRIHSGVMYRMEIQEGPKGPLFVITSTDGESCSGQTPDIAWETFQKKGGPRAKLGHGKRFSCKIDGTEFFGFKNPLVQRFLRELMANVNGIALQNSTSPDICNGGVNLMPVNQVPKSCPHPASPVIAPCPKAHRSNRKRKMKHRTQTTSFIDDEIKKIHIQGPSNDADHSSDCTGSRLLDCETVLTSTLDREREVNNDSKALSVDEVTLVELRRHASPVTVGISLKFSNLGASFSGGRFFWQEYKGVWPKDFTSFTVLDLYFVDNTVFLVNASDICKRNILNFQQLDNRSLNIQIEGCNALDAIKGNSGGTLDLTESRNAEEMDISVSVKGSGFAGLPVDSPPDCYKGSSSQVEPHHPASNRIISDETTTNSFSQKSLDTYVSNASPERTDFDSEGQDCLTSMMKVLLPQALTLLKKAPTRTKPMFQSSEFSLANDHSLSLTGTKSSIHPTEAISPGKTAVETSCEGPSAIKETKMHGLSRILDSSEVVESVVPDSLDDNEQLRNNVNNQWPLCSNLIEVGEMAFDKKEHNSDCASLLGCADIHNKSLNFQSRMSGNSELLYDTDTQCPNDITEEEVVISDSPIGYSSPKKETFLEGRSDLNDRESDPGVDSTGDMLKESLGVVNGPIQDVTAIEPFLPMRRESHSPLTSVVGCEAMNVIPPNERSCGNTSFHVETTFRPKAAPFSSESGFSQRVVNSDSTKKLEARDKEESKNKIFCKIEVAQYCRRKYHSKGPKLQNGRIHQQQSNDCVLDDRDCIDSYKLYGNQDTRIGSTCNAGASNDSHEETKVPRTGNTSSLIQYLDPPIMPFNGLLSESIICRNANGDSLSEAYPVTELVQVGSLSRGMLSKEVASRKDAKIDDQHEGLTHGDLGCGGMPARSTSSQNLTVDSAEENLLSISSDLLTIEAEKHPSDAAVELKGHDIVNCNSTSSLCPRKEINLDDLSRHEVKEILADWDIQTPGSPVSRSGQECGNLLSHTMIRQESKLMDQISPNMDFDRERENVVELLGCYMHPAPVLSMLLTSREEEVHVAVLCGCLEEQARTIFVYKIPIGTQRGGCPSFIGYTVMLPLMENRYKIELGTSSLQFTPDWQCLVFHNSIKAPSCRERSMDCLCSTCTSNCFGENALKVVHVKLGYVSLVVKLKTVESVHCVLVCESNHIVAVEESGSLHVWIMCANWSSCTEEFILANFDDSYHHILELKRIPKSPFLIIGHNGAGNFTLWDLSKRAILSRYSAPTKSVFHVLPIGAFSWDEKGYVPTGSDVEGHVNEIMATAKLWFSQSGKQLLSNWKDPAVWLLVSADCDFQIQNNNEGAGINKSPETCWRLALLVKNNVIFGRTIDTRVAAIDASASHAVIGTSSGHVYVWEMSTGRKSDLHYFQGKLVSCIASDSQSDMVAVASEDSELLIFSTGRIRVA